MSKSRDNFVRLAESRTNNILKSLELLGNLSNRTNYSYSDEDVQKIFSSLNRKMKQVRQKFDLTSKKRESEGFKL